MSEEKISKHERENLLIKLEKEFAFAGVTIPQELEADGEHIKLKAFVFNISKNRGNLTTADATEVDRITALVRKKLREIISRIS
jgi:hypothetical protein